MHFILKIWFTPNEFLSVSYKSSIQSTRVGENSDSNSLWIMRYCKFCDDNFVDFSISHLFYYYETSNLRQKLHSCSKKPNDAVEVFQSIERKHHWGALGVGFSLELFDTRIWQQRNYFFLKSKFYIMASKNIFEPSQVASWRDTR